MNKFPLVLAGLLAGCQITPPPIVHQPMSVRPPLSPSSAQSNGAIYQVSNSYRPMFEDRRARYVGDTLVVNIVEKTQANKKSGTNVDKSNAMQYGVTSLQGLPGKSFLNSSLNANSSTKFDGSGQSTANNDFAGTITATVIDVAGHGVHPLFRGGRSAFHQHAEHGDFHSGGRCTHRVPRQRHHRRGPNPGLARAVLPDLPAVLTMKPTRCNIRAVLSLALYALVLALGLPDARAERIKDLVSVQGARGNQLIGYGLVVGLDNSGDQTTQTPFTVQSVVNMLSQLGVNVPPGVTMQLKNVAAVMVTSTLPAFASLGQTIDVTVSSLGNAKSLRGGTLLISPLKGADGQIYAMAQGNVAVGGAGASANGSKVQINHLNAGRIPAGATVERTVPTQVGQGDFLQLEVNTTDFTTVARIVDAINGRTAPGTAQAVDGRVIRVSAPADANERVAFLSRIESIDVALAPTMAKVIVNSRTGSIVMNQTVRVETCAVAHGNLSVVITTTPVISQPGAFSLGRTVEAKRSDVQIQQEAGSLIMVPVGVSLADVVRGLNALGANPADLVSILQAMKAAGALRADLEII